ncbi:MAG TPA: 16S rRNA (guanine(527)-N(7))-methyltransferase RsmG [Actinomycetota bacterium]
MKHEGLTSQAAELGVSLADDQVARLEAFEQLLTERGAPLGVVSTADVPRLRERHVLDSLRAALAVEADDRYAVDLGSGGGLPGIIVAIARPALSVVLVESRARRAAFLELATERLWLANADVRRSRVEDVRGPFDLAFARAFAGPEGSWRAAAPLLGAAGRLVYFAGTSFRAADVPAGVDVRILTAPPVASRGPLAIMSRQ